MKRRIRLMITLLNNQTPTRVDPRNHTQTAIDLSLITPNLQNVKWSIQQHNFDPSYSDHYNIFITIPLKYHLKENIYHSTWILNSKSKWKKYSKKLENELSKITQSQHPNINAQNITNTIYNTAISTIGYRNYKRGYKPWWNFKINKLKHAAKQLNRKIHKIKSKYPDHYMQIPKFQRLNLEYKSIQHHQLQNIRIAKKIHQEKINKFLSESKFNNKLSWKLLKIRGKTKNNDIPPFNFKNKIIFDPIQKAETLHNVLTNPPLPTLENKHKKFHNTINEKIKNIQNDIPHNNINTLNDPIQKYELLNSIK